MRGPTHSMSMTFHSPGGLAALTFGATYLYSDALLCLSGGLSPSSRICTSYAAAEGRVLSDIFRSNGGVRMPTPLLQRSFLGPNGSPIRYSTCSQKSANS